MKQDKNGQITLKIDYSDVKPLLEMLDYAQGQAQDAVDVIKYKGEWPSAYNTQEEWDRALNYQAMRTTQILATMMAKLS